MPKFTTDEFNAAEKFESPYQTQQEEPHLEVCSRDAGALGRYRGKTDAPQAVLGHPSRSERSQVCNTTTIIVAEEGHRKSTETIGTLFTIVLSPTMDIVLPSSMTVAAHDSHQHKSAHEQSDNDAIFCSLDSCNVM